MAEMMLENHWKKMADMNNLLKLEEKVVEELLDMQSYCDDSIPGLYDHICHIFDIQTS